MVAHTVKKTTINIEDAVMERLKEEAARRKTTMTALIEAGIRRILAEGEAPAPAAGELPPLPSWHGGEFLVDITDRDALYGVLDRERDERLYGRSSRPEVAAVAEEPAAYDAGEETSTGADDS